MESNKKWIIRDAAGRISGPFTTEKILYSIGRGEFSGEEHVSFYPGGKWIPMSQDPQFYDKLLEVLSANPNVEASPQTRVLEFTKPLGEDDPLPPPPKNRASRELPPEPADDDEEEFKMQTATKLPNEAPPGMGPASTAEPEKPKKKKRHKEPEDIELVDTRGETTKQILKRARLPIAIAVFAGAFMAIFMGPSDTKEERIHLLAPQKAQKQMAPEQLSGRFRKGVGEFQKDTFESYSSAQNELVYVVEHNTKGHDAMALLCMTYFQLWPYSYQNSDDQKAIAQVVQMSSAVDPAGMNSATCRVVDFIVRARFPEAKSLVEAMLDSPQTANQPPIIFYFFRGYLLEGAGEHSTATGYLRTAQQLWPQWILPYMLEAQALVKSEKHPDAASIYRKVLTANPGHKVARIELGLLEYKYFNHYQLGEQYLNAGLNGDNSAPRPIMSRGYFGLAEINLKKGDNSKALKFAQKSFSLNSSYIPAKNLIVQLGGVGVLKKTKVKGQELVFQGDQYQREGDCHAAQAHYKAAFEEDPKNAIAAVRAAQCLWKLSFSTEAIDWLNKAIKADPKQIEAYVTMSDYYAQRYNFLAAAKILEQGRKQNPKSHEVFRGYALVELRRGDAGSAINFGKKAMQLYENDVETQIILAQASAALKDYKMSYNYAAKAIEIDVNDRKAQIAYAEALAGLQGVDAGKDYYLRLINNYPLVGEYRLALGRLYLSDERYTQAEEIFRQVIKLEDKPKEAYVELAKVLRAQGNTNDALDLLLKAAVLDPADAEPLYLAGGIYLDTKKPAEAMNLFSRVLVINNLYPLTHYQMGRATMLMKDPRETLKHAEEEKRVNPNLADAFILAAEAQNELQQYTMCANEYQKALKLRPQPATVYVKLAQCYRKASNLEVAQSMLAVASTKESGLADIYKEQGAIYEMKGDTVHAIEAYNQYLALNPDAPDKDKLEQRISDLQRGKVSKD